MKKTYIGISLLVILIFGAYSMLIADMFHSKAHLVLEKSGLIKKILESQARKTNSSPAPAVINAPIVTISAGPKTSLTTNAAFKITLNVDKDSGYWSTNGSSFHQFAKGNIDINIVHDTVLRFYGFDGTRNSSTNTNFYRIKLVLLGTALWNMNTAAEMAKFDNDGSGSVISFDTTTVTNTNGNGIGSFKLSPSTTGLEAKIKVDLTAKLGSWKGTKLDVLIKLPINSNISNISVSMFTAPIFNWIDMSTISGPFIEGVWTKISIPLTINMINAANWATNGQKISLDLIVQSKSAGVKSAVNLNGISIVNAKSSYFGAWPHYMDSAGNGSEGDIVETAYVVEGLLASIQYFSNNNSDENLIRSTASNLWRNIDWNAFRDGSQKMNWSYTSAGVFSGVVDGFNECMNVYLLGMASPTHPIPVSCYNNGWAPAGYSTTEIHYGYKQYVQLWVGWHTNVSLFWTQFSYLGFDPRTMDDGKIDDAGSYYKVFQNISMINYAHCTNAPLSFGYKPNLWGLTACDGPSPNYYWARSPAQDDGTVAPTAALSAMPYVPAKSYAALTNYLKNPALGSLRGTYGFKDSFNPQQGWYDNDYIAIDQGPIIVMIENYRSQLLWKLFMSHPDIKALMTKLGSNGWIIHPQTYNNAPLDSTPMNSASLNTVQSNTLQYFLQGSSGCDPSGMARDRLNANIASGGTGMGMMAIIVGIERKFITRSAGVSQIKNILNFLKEAQ